MPTFIGFAVSAVAWVLILKKIPLNSSGMVILQIPRVQQLVNGNATTLDALIDRAVQAQNCYRAKHSASPLVLDETISRVSQSWADHMAATGQFGHSGSQYGENIFGAGSSIRNGGVPIFYWYKEWEDVHYDFTQNSDQGAGHFTQLVWKESKRTGFGIANNQNYVYVVANYDPPGNYLGQYLQNVSPPSDENINSCANLQSEEFIDSENILVAQF